MILANFHPKFINLYLNNFILISLKFWYYCLTQRHFSESEYICTEAPWISLHLTKEFAIFPANSTKIEHLKVKKHCWLTIFMKFVGTIGWQPPTLEGVKVTPYEQMDQETQKLPYLSGFESVFCQRWHTQYFLYYMVKIRFGWNWCKITFQRHFCNPTGMTVF